MSTHFYVKELETNPKELNVKAHGQPISRFSEKGFETIPAIYGLSFERIGGKLLLQEFVKSRDKLNEDYYPLSISGDIGFSHAMFSFS